MLSSSSQKNIFLRLRNPGLKLVICALRFQSKQNKNRTGRKAQETSRSLREQMVQSQLIKRHLVKAETNLLFKHHSMKDIVTQNQEMFPQSSDKGILLDLCVPVGMCVLMEEVKQSRQRLTRYRKMIRFFLYTFV